VSFCLSFVPDFHDLTVIFQNSSSDDRSLPCHFKTLQFTSGGSSRTLPSRLQGTSGRNCHRDDQHSSSNYSHHDSRALSLTPRCS
jgi:hypothetical protein